MTNIQVKKFNSIGSQVILINKLGIRVWHGSLSSISAFNNGKSIKKMYCISVTWFILKRVINTVKYDF